MKKNRRRGRERADAWPGAAARAAVEEVRAALPPDVRRRADEVAVAFERDVPRAWLDEGIEPDTLGLFSGPSMRDPDGSWSDEAPLVTLFLGPLLDYSGGDREAFLE